jgi:hypothetical protein
MARTAIATLQTIWDCRWSQPGHRLNGVPDAKQPEGTWVCVREGARRTIDEDECATCAHWELAHTAPLTAAPTAAAAITSPVVVGVQSTRLDRALHLMTWACIVLTALVLGAAGLAVLTSPLAIPLTITLWLTAATIIGFAATGNLPDGH